LENTQHQIFKGVEDWHQTQKTIHTLSEDVLRAYTNKQLMNKYDVYQHVMNYWNEVMQDDCYLVAVDGWKAEPYRILVKNKAGKETDKGWDCDLVPKTLVVSHYFKKEQQAIEEHESQLEIYASTLKELEEDNGEEGVFEDFEKVSKLSVLKRLKELEAEKKGKKKQASATTELDEDKELGVLKQYLKIVDDYAALNSLVKNDKAELDKLALARYKTLTETDIKQLVVDDKWMASFERSIQTEMERISQRLTQRIKELAERYETPLPEQTADVAVLEEKVKTHLQKMGFVWN
jgi:type I restriction enzyme M protein